MSSGLSKSLSAQAEPRADHLPAFDGVRGIAILLVMAHNFQLLNSPSDLFGRVIEAAFDFGWVGVQLFFVLSGFLITRILLRTQLSPHYYQAFFGRRVLRIFPLYYAALFMAFVVLPWLGCMPEKLAEDSPNQIWLWVYLSNWSDPLGVTVHGLPHFWSLAVEEQFYLVWPFLIHRRTPHQVLRLCLGLAVLSLVIRLALLWGGAGVDAVYKFSICRIDALTLGGAVAAWLAWPQRPRWASLEPSGCMWMAGTLFAAGAVLTHAYPRTSFLSQTLGYSILAVVFALWLLALAQTSAGPQRQLSIWQATLRAAPLRLLGRYSYAMYIFHKPMHDFIGKPMLASIGVPEHPGTLAAVLYVAAAILVSLCVGALSYHLFEKHFLALKSRFVADQTPAVASAVAPIAR